MAFQVVCDNCGAEYDARFGCVCIQAKLQRLADLGCNVTVHRAAKRDSGIYQGQAWGPVDAEAAEEIAWLETYVC